jgi:methyltransferase (TIGR00027 family)
MPQTEHMLDGVAQTSLITLYVRAIETKRPDALLCDEKAVELVERSSSDFAFIEKLRLDEGDRVTLVLRNREFDEHARRFMEQHSGAVVVHIGCGLDARFERVDDGAVDWYDLDLPDVMALRERLLGGEGPRHRLVSCSALDEGWMDPIAARARPTLFLAEGVFMYFEPEQVRSLVLTMLRRFDGSELVLDTLSPFMVRMNNLRMRGPEAVARAHWGLSRGDELQAWDPGIRLLDEWHPFSRDEPRLARYRWMRHIPAFARVISVFHYRLGGQ